MLRRFARYLDKMFTFRRLVDSLVDQRPFAQISTATIWRSLFTMFVLRLPSLNALDHELRRRQWGGWIAGRKPSGDTVAYAAARLDVDSLRRVVEEVARTSWRRKAIHLSPGESYRVVALDGHELFSSRARCCDKCLVRELKTKDGPVLEYYHRVVTAQWVGVTPPMIMDVEPVLPKEGEVAAAGRLLSRLLVSYNRLIDVFTLDALYLEGPFLRSILDAGKHFVVVLKQEARLLYQDVEQLRGHIQPRTERQGKRNSRIWDLPNLTSFPTLGTSVRVVCAEETEHRKIFEGGVSKEVTQQSLWMWVTDLPVETAAATRIQKWGHQRWDIENRGFNELVQLWNMNHCFAHDPTAILTFLLTLALAFATTYLFHTRNLKPAARACVSRLDLARHFLAALPLLRMPARRAALEPSG